MDRKLLERNLKLYVWYVLLGQPLFWGPILLTSIMSLGKLSLPDVYLMEAVVMLGFSVVEVHTGAVADVIGRRITIILGKTLQIIGMIWFSCMQTPFDAWGANIVFMLGISFCSGSDRALIMTSLKRMGYNDEGAKSKFAEITSKAQAHSLLLMGCTSLLSGFLAEVHIRIPLFLSIPGMLVCTCIVCFFTEYPNGTEKKKKKKSLRDRVRDFLVDVKETIIQGFKVFKKTKVLWWLVLTFALLDISSKTWFFSYNSYFELVDIPYRYFGLIFFLLNVVGWYFAKNAKRIMETTNRKCIVSIMILTIGVPIVLMGVFIYPVSAGLVVFQNYTRGVARSMFTSEIHHQIHSEELRATVDSWGSAIHCTLEAITLLLYRMSLNYNGFTFTLILLGCIVLFFGSISIGTYKKVFKN